MPSLKERMVGALLESLSLLLTALLPPRLVLQRVPVEELRRTQGE